MRLLSEVDAATVACEMEKRAISVYERARTLMDDERFRAVFTRLLADEQKHLEAFERLRGCEATLSESCMVLSAMAGDVIMPGGLTQMELDGAFASPEALVKWALYEEEGAVESYMSFSEHSSGAVRAMFDDIASQELGHCADLKALLAEVTP